MLLHQDNILQKTFSAVMATNFKHSQTLSLCFLHPGKGKLTFPVIWGCSCSCCAGRWPSGLRPRTLWIYWADSAASYPVLYLREEKINDWFVTHRTTQSCLWSTWSTHICRCWGAFCWSRKCSCSLNSALEEIERFSNKFCKNYKLNQLFHKSGVTVHYLNLNIM